MPDLTRFAGADPRYLRTVQYVDGTKLAARARLHIAYGTAPVPWFPWLAQQIDWPPAAEILEVGCGSGWLWADAAAHVPAGARLTLTDLSPGMVAEARTRAIGAGLRVAGAGTAAAQQLPFGDDAFDVVVANHMLYHVPRPETAVVELARVLRPGGVALVSTNGPDHLRELWRLRADVFGVDRVDPTSTAFGSETGRPMLERSFAEAAWRPYPDELRCTRPADVYAYLCSMPPGEDATAEEKVRLRAAVQAAFVAGGGVLRITKDTGVFVVRGPRRP